jgi:hypothetical protein
MAQHAKEPIAMLRFALQIGWHYFRDASIDCFIKSDYRDGLISEALGTTARPDLRE